MSEAIRLTQYSHGAGCGCKISPKVLEVILAGSGAQNLDPKLWSATPRATTRLPRPRRGARGGLHHRFLHADRRRPFDFGRIAATNAISDIYAMGGDPLMAIRHPRLAGQRVLAAEVAREVIAGGRKVCEEAGIPLAGGHPSSPRADLRPGRDRRGGRSASETQRHRRGRLQAVPDQAAGHRHPHHCREEARLRAEDVGVARDWMCTRKSPRAPSAG